jgi:hypothetical protein
MLSKRMSRPVKRMNPFHVIGWDASNPLRGAKLGPDGCRFQKVSMCGESASSVHEYVLFVDVLAVGSSQPGAARALCLAGAWDNFILFFIFLFFLFFFVVSYQSSWE